MFSNRQKKELVKIQPKCLPNSLHIQKKNQLSNKKLTGKCQIPLKSTSNEFIPFIFSDEFFRNPNRGKTERGKLRLQRKGKGLITSQIPLTR